MCNFMALPDVSDGSKFWIFYGAALLWVLWGLVDYFFSYAFVIFLGIMILVLIGWIGVVAWKNMNVLMPAGIVRDHGVKIP